MPTNRTNLSPNTTDACTVALTVAADRAEVEFNRTDQHRADVRDQWQQARGALKKDLALVLEDLVSRAHVAEVRMRQARWALHEFRKVAGLDETGTPQSSRRGEPAGTLGADS